MKELESLIVLAIIILVVIQPIALVKLNATILGKLFILIGLIMATLYKPYIGLLVLLLIICLTMNREGFADNIEEDEEEDENTDDLSIENEEQLIA